MGASGLFLFVYRTTAYLLIHHFDREIQKLFKLFSALPIGAYSTALSRIGQLITTLRTTTQGEIHPPFEGHPLVPKPLWPFG